MAGRMRTPSGTWANLRLYISRQAASPARYLLEQFLCALVGWVPTVVGIGLRALLYRLILHIDGVAAIENGVRIRFASNTNCGSKNHEFVHSVGVADPFGRCLHVRRGAIKHGVSLRGTALAG
jgi:hypothetical protein